MSTALSRNSAAYKNLACYNIGVLALNVVSFWECRWVVKVTIPATMEREQLKRHVEHFLEVEFEASEFKWMTVKGSPYKVAYCSFKSFAL